MTYDLADIRRKLEMGADIGHETLKAAFLQAEADAAAMRRVLKKAQDWFHQYATTHAANGKQDKARVNMERSVKCELALSSTAGRDLLERMERMQEALDGINTFAWSAMIADCEESRLECGRRINACRAALADKEPTP